MREGKGAFTGMLMIVCFFSRRFFEVKKVPFEFMYGTFVFHSRMSCGVGEELIDPVFYETGKDMNGWNS